MDNVKEKIAIASDHAGFHLKEKIKLNLEENGYGVIDLGTNSEEAVDYPDYGKALAQNRQGYQTIRLTWFPLAQLCVAPNLPSLPCDSDEGE